MRLTILIVLLIFEGVLFSQELNLENIWKNGSFRMDYQSSPVSMEDGVHFTTINEGQILKHSFLTGEVVDTLVKSTHLMLEGFKFSIEDYEFNKDETKLLLLSEVESLYRRSSKAQYYLFDLKTKQILPVNEKKVMCATFSTDGSKIAYVFENNLYIFEPEIMKTIKVTDDGRMNEIINGTADWVYEEEFSLVNAFKWSPDGNKLTWLRFDESQVKEFGFDTYNDLYPERYTYKYPKVGEENSKISIHVYDLLKEEQSEIKLDNNFEYIPRFEWVNKDVLAIMTLNRDQNSLQIHHCNLIKGKSTVFYSEQSETYIEVPFWKYINNTDLILSSEKEGYNHLYFITSKQISQLTEGPWEIDQIYGYDEKRKEIFYSSTEVNPMERHVYAVNLENRKKRRLSDKDGVHEFVFSKNFDYYTDYFSDANHPFAISLYSNNGELIREQVNNDSLKTKLDEFDLVEKEFIEVPTPHGKLNAWIMKPRDFDPEKKYPLIMMVYGGPGHQTVMNQWEGSSYLWHQLLVKSGYVVVSVENRGTNGRGATFRKESYGKMGEVETIDQTNSALFFIEKYNLDPKRIGVFGWSYGGYLSSLCLMKSSAVFNLAIAVAPVTNWKYYDSIYTERYMKTLEKNVQAYEENAPIHYVDSLKGDYLLVHGLADDNVHFQHSAELIKSLVNANKQFDLYVYPNNDHSIGGGKTRLHLYQKITNFILEKL